MVCTHVFSLHTQPTSAWYLNNNHWPIPNTRTLEETEVLIAGVEKCGGGRWADIKKLGYAVIDRRSPVDLKDKWRNLIRVACQPASVQNRNKADKRREIPDDLLARVRAVVDGSGGAAGRRGHHHH